MARRLSGGWWLQSAFWGMVGDRFSLSDSRPAFSVREEERRGALQGLDGPLFWLRGSLGSGGCLSSVLGPECSPP
ncbi:hypothetical protein F2Q69_00002101 [Brassica cretica]|uniref:Uncharacterized protein n=1 Tax=Brassica cretica TaxID=69181 RepID=A0A8S9NX82_BRACR|nr:hypothetical protein F2Q69_00002101 [Brassica cretica]